MASASGESEVPSGVGGRASDVVAQELRRLIVTGEIVSGGHLQPTNTLIARFGVSRPTLREAFRILENERLVSVSRGSRSGVRVLRPSTDAASRVAGQTLQATGATIGDLYQALLGFEPFAVRLLAERHDRGDLTRLRAHLATLDESLLIAPVAEHGVRLARFHHLLVELTGNKVMMLMADLIADAIERHQQADSGERFAVATGSGDPKAFRAVGLKSIRKLLRLIEAGDADEAEAHWRNHLRNANEFWLAGQDREAPVTVVR